MKDNKDEAQYEQYVLTDSVVLENWTAKESTLEYLDKKIGIEQTWYSYMYDSSSQRRTHPCCRDHVFSKEKQFTMLQRS